MSALAAVCCASARVTKRSSSSRTRNGVGEKSHDGRTASARMDVSISPDDRALIIVQERKKGRKEERKKIVVSLRTQTRKLLCQQTAVGLSAVDDQCQLTINGFKRR